MDLETRFKAAAQAPRRSSTLASGALIAFALSSLLWVSLVAPSFWRLQSANTTATRIIADERFRPGALQAALARVEDEPIGAPSHPGLKRARALILLRIAEESKVRKSSAEVDRDIDAALQSVKSMLAMSPQDSLLWLGLYLLETAYAGFDATRLRYLFQSYNSGPYEGWIAIRRNRVSLSAFPVHRSFEEQVIAEFAHLVDSSLLREAEASLTTTGWRYRDQLLSALKEVDPGAKRSFYKLLTTDGFLVSIPGVVVEERPWK